MQAIRTGWYAGQMAIEWIQGASILPFRTFSFGTNQGRHVSGLVFIPSLH